MFSVGERDRLRSELAEAARGDDRLGSAAVLGSATVGREDRWSDLDLALCVGDKADREAVIADWTELMYREHGAVHHLDVVWGEGLYRCFLLSSTLQVDLSFWPQHDFRPTGAAFALLFGQAGESRPAAQPRAEALIGGAWLYALHAHRCIARGRPWQAEYMLSAARNQLLALSCLRHGLPARLGRGLDQLPAEVRTAAELTLIGSLHREVLTRALTAIVEALLGEIEHADPALARQLDAPLRELSSV